MPTTRLNMIPNKIPYVITSEKRNARFVNPKMLAKKEIIERTIKICVLYLIPQTEVCG